jgi:hypothetical protein
MAGIGPCGGRRPSTAALPSAGGFTIAAMSELSTYTVRFVPPRPWTAEDERRVQGNGWSRWRPDWGDGEIFLNGIRAASDREARVMAMGAFRLAPHDIVIAA